MGFGTRKSQPAINSFRAFVYSVGSIRVASCASPRSALSASANGVARSRLALSPQHNPFPGFLSFSPRRFSLFSYSTGLQLVSIYLNKPENP